MSYAKPLAWTREGRKVRKGEHAALFLLSDDRTQARALFRLAQTETQGMDESDSWTIVVDAAEWERSRPRPERCADTRA